MVEAKDETVIAQEKEQVEMAYVSATINKLSNNVSEEDLQEELEKTVGKNKTNITNNGNGTLNVEFIETGHDYNVNKGTVTRAYSPIKISIEVSGKNQIVNTDATVVKEVRDNNVPIPYGFYYVDGDKKTGLVISDVENDDLDNSKGGHQFVWVPVQVEQKIIIKVTSENELKNITINDEEIPCSGKEFTKIIENPRLNGLYDVTATDVNENFKNYYKELRCFYGQDFLEQIRQIIDNINDESNDRTFDTIEEFATANGVTVEELETILDGMDISIKEYCLMGGIIIKELDINTKSSFLYWQKLMQNENKDLYSNIESVEKYGGFYVGRYEMGAIKGIEYKDYNYNTANVEASSLIDNESTESVLISGCGFDTTLNYICQNNEKGYDLAIMNFKEWYFKGGKKTGDNIEDEYCHISGFTNNWKQLTSERYIPFDNHFNCRGEGSVWSDKTDYGACARGSMAADHRAGNGYTTAAYRTQLFLK